jgi:hypothetical protein
VLTIIVTITGRSISRLTIIVTIMTITGRFIYSANHYGNYNEEVYVQC